MATTPSSLRANIVSMIELKNLARRLLPQSSTLRMLILCEPDYMPKTELLPKLDIFVKLLHREIGGAR